MFSPDLVTKQAKTTNIYVYNTDWVWIIKEGACEWYANKKMSELLCQTSKP